MLLHFSIWYLIFIPFAFRIANLLALAINHLVWSHKSLLFYKHIDFLSLWFFHWLPLKHEWIFEIYCIAPKTGFLSVSVIDTGNGAFVGQIRYIRKLRSLIITLAFLSIFFDVTYQGLSSLERLCDHIGNFEHVYFRHFGAFKIPKYIRFIC